MDQESNSIASVNGRKTLTVKRKLYNQISSWCLTKGFSAFHFFLAVLFICFHKLSGLDQLVIGVPLLNRQGKQKRMIGHFANVIPLKITVNRAMAFPDLLTRIKNELSECYRHQKLPYGEIYRTVYANEQFRRPLFEISLSYEKNEFQISMNNTVKNQAVTLSNPHPRNALAVYVQNFTAWDDIELNFDFQKAVFEQYLPLERIVNYFSNIMNSLAANPLLRISEIDMLSPQERQQILVEFNATHTGYPNKTIHQLFEEQVVKTPDHIAVVFEDQQLTYRELNENSNQLARVLKSNGIGPDKIVAIMMQRSLELIVAVLGVLKAGGAYLPVDPAYPVDRIEYMLENSGAAILLGPKCHPVAVNFKGLTIDLNAVELSTMEITNPDPVNSPGNLAYIIYTSGTTGKPKGVMIEHSNVVRLMFNDQMPFDFDDKDVWTLFHSFCFDFSVWEMYGALLYGGKLVIVPKLTAQNTGEYLKLIQKEKVTILNQTPTAFNSLMAEERKCRQNKLPIRYVIFGGEALKPVMLKEWRTKYPQTKLINMYGITETTVHVTYKEITEAEIESNVSKIGKPLPTLTTYIMDRDLRLLPVGVAGELCVGGAGVGRGYLNNRELTAEKFVPNPYNPQERLYKSGDLARFLPDGDLEYLGRIDHQVKVRGFRIELGEIESQLLKHDLIQETVVVAHEDRQGSKFLCAYLVGAADLTTTQLREHLAKDLPDYMIPSYFVQLEKLPLTPNGKIDLKALPQPVGNIKTGEKYIEPRNTIEARIKQVWQSVLAIEKFGINDNFFALGGDSLKAVQVAARLGKDYEVALNDIFEHPTVAGLAQKAVCTQGLFKKWSDSLLKMAARQETDRTMELQHQRKLAKYLAASHRYQGLNVTLGSGYHKVLLLGSTGFLGAHLLYQLFHHTDYDIFVLVRGKDQTAAQNRLWQRLDYYFNFSQAERVALSRRIRVYPGDLTVPYLGLTEVSYYELAHEIDVIINSAADVRHFGLYSDFYATNVSGNDALIKLAQTGIPKDFNLISTLSVGAGTIANTPRVLFTEDDCDLGQQIENYYIKTKFEAEKLLLKAREDGLKVNVFRVGNLVFDADTGIFQENIAANAFYTLLKALIRIGVFPDLARPGLEFSYVNCAAEAIIKLFDKKALQNETYHICNDHRLRFSQLKDLLNQVGITVEVTSINRFLELIAEKFVDEQFQEHVANLMLHSHVLDILNQTEFEILSHKTNQILALLGFEWAAPDVARIDAMVQHCRKVNFW